MIKFRGKLLDRLDRAIEKEKIILPADMNHRQWTNLKNKLGRKVTWNVNIRERYPHGKGVLIYLARYLRGGPIANHRIVSCENDEVTFSYRVNGKKSKKKDFINLPIGDFIKRYLLHVQAPNSKNVRSYGLYAPDKKKDLEKCRSIFGQLPVAEEEFLTWQQFCEEQGEEHPELCPVCEKKLVHLDSIPAERDPLQVKVALEKKWRRLQLKFPFSVGDGVIYDGAFI